MLKSRIQKILKFELHKNEALFSSPFSISPDGVNTVIRQKGTELQYSKQQQRIQVGWGCSPLGAGKVQVCHSSILMPLPLGQPDICLFSLAYEYYFLYILTYRRLKSTALLYCKANFWKCTVFLLFRRTYVLNSCLSLLKKKKPTLLPVIGLKGAISAANYNIKCTSCHRHLRIRVLIPYTNSDLFQKKTFMIKYCYFWIWNLH